MNVMMSNWIGKWVRPWPGESVAGHVVAVVGDQLILQDACGHRFEMNLSDVANGKVGEVGLMLRPLPAPPLQKVS